MKSWSVGLWLAVVALQTQASERWVFEGKTGIGAAPIDGVYHHLDGAGRKHIAIAGNRVAVTWEDNHSGAPQVYVAVKSLQLSGFAAPLLASSGREAYEPAIAITKDNRFVLAYEQDASVFARVLAGTELAEPILLGKNSAGHASVAAFDDRVYASWRERVDGLWFVKVAVLRVDSANRLLLESIRAIEDSGLPTPVQFPTIVANAAGISIAWEDRRAGHTRLLASHAASAEQAFGEPQALNEIFSNRNEYDKGNGVTRVSMAAFGEDEILAAWMDKRRGGAGYGIFAALGAIDIFGPNEKVHGDEGDRQPHYNPATAGNSNGDFVVAWDDFRRGDLDIWISSQNSDLEWSEDHTPAVASGPGEQSHASVALDDHGNLHLLWIERSQPDSPSRLWYSMGRPAAAD